MAGDDKHARELIARARAYMASNQNQHGRGGLVDQLADALEAALPGDDDWEYGVRNLTSGEVFEPVNGRWWRTTDNEESVRRRPAGPWELVEEVPR